MAKYELVEDDQVVITMFGKPVGGAKTVPGEYYLLPLIHKAHYFKKNIHLYEMTSVVRTADEKSLKLNTTVQWKISDAVQYMKKLNSYKLANEFLSDTIINAQLKVIIDKTLENLIGAKANMPPITDLEITYSPTYQIEKLAAKNFSSVGLELLNVEILATYQTSDYKVLTPK